MLYPKIAHANQPFGGCWCDIICIDCI